MRRQDEKGRFVRQSMTERFWDFVDNSGGDDDCWMWTGYIDQVGYGRITDYWQKLGAHRFSYEMHVGPIPAGRHVLHSCDVRACVNPRHLRVGTHADNMRDMVERGRTGILRHPESYVGMPGMTNARAVLTDEQVLDIRARFVRGGRGRKGEPRTGTLQDLADEYGVSKSLVHNIVNRKAWTHI